MKKIVFLLLIMSSVCAWGTGRSAKIFMVNLFAQDMDAQLGEDKKFIYKVDGLEPYTSSYYVTTENFGSYPLYFKLSSGNDWYFLSDTNEAKVNCTVNPSKIYTIVVDERGVVKIFESDDSFDRGAKLGFFNGSYDVVNRMEIGTKWKEGNIAFSDTLDPYTVTNFCSFKNGGYSLYWQFPHQQTNDDYFFYPDENGVPLQFKFESDKYYLFMIYTIDDTDYGTLYDITPKENIK